MDSMSLVDRRIRGDHRGGRGAARTARRAGRRGRRRPGRAISCWASWPARASTSAAVAVRDGAATGHDRGAVPRRGPGDPDRAGRDGLADRGGRARRAARPARGTCTSAPISCWRTRSGPGLAAAVRRRAGRGCRRRRWTPTGTRPGRWGDDRCRAALAQADLLLPNEAEALRAERRSRPRGGGAALLAAGAAAGGQARRARGAVRRRAPAVISVSLPPVTAGRRDRRGRLLQRRADRRAAGTAWPCPPRPRSAAPPARCPPARPAGTGSCPDLATALAVAQTATIRPVAGLPGLPVRRRSIGWRESFSTRSNMVYPGGVKAVERAQPGDPRRRVHGVRGAVRLRQDDRAAVDRRAGARHRAARSPSATGWSTTWRRRTATSPWSSRTTRSTHT